MTAPRALLGTICAAVAWADAGFDALYNLDFDGAIEQFSAQVKRTPRDPAAHNHLAHALLYGALHRADGLDFGLALSPSRFLRTDRPNVPEAEKQRFLNVIEESLRLSRGSKQAADLYAAGVAHIHRAHFEIFVNKTWRASLRDATRARELHQEALRANPRWADARLIPAAHDYLVGSLPWYVRAIGFLAGFRGDKEGGIRGVRVAAEQGVRTKVEAQLLLAIIHRREREPVRAAKVLAELCRQYPRNYLFRMERIHALLAASNKEAALSEFGLLKRYQNLKPERLETFRRSVAL